MEDDWASPWADADDRSPTEVIKNLDAHDADDAATRSGRNEPESRTPGSSNNNNVAVHTNDPWGGGEHGFGDASAWASPGVGVGEIPPVVSGGSGLPVWDVPSSVEVPSFVVEKAPDVKRRASSNAIGDIVQQTGAGKAEEWFGGATTSSNLPIATGEADIWAAGSDWGDNKSERADELPVEKKNLSSEIAPENIPLPEFDDLVEGTNEDASIDPESVKEDIFFDATTSDHEPAEYKLEKNLDDEPIDSTKASTKYILPVLESESGADQQSKQESEFTEKAESTEAKVKEKETDEEGPKDEETKEEEDDEDDEDDFGDFADEGDFEDAEENLPSDAPASVETPLPPTPGLRPDITFDIKTSLVNKLYPLLAAYPEPPPIRELIYTTESRKAWYRLSQSGTIRKDKSGDDDYVRVTWHGSKVQEDVNKIVARWMAEDRSSGSGVALGGSRRLGAMFGWGEGVESAEKKATPTQLNLGKPSSSGQSSIDVFGSVQGAMKSPFSISTTVTRPVESGVTPSPQTASFGWSSTDTAQPVVGSHPSSSAASTKGEDKPPSTPSRASFYGTPGPSRMSSQPVTPSRSTKPHSPISSNHSRQVSHSLALTQPSSPSQQSIKPSAGLVETISIPPTRIDSPFSSTPAASRSTLVSDAPAASAPASGFDEWGAFEHMATTVKTPSTKEANCDFDEWGALGDIAKVVDVKPASEGSTQNQISGLPVKVSGMEEKAIGSKEDEWNVFEESGATSSFGGSSKRSSIHAPAKLEQRPGPKGRTDDWGSLAISESSLTVKASISGQPLDMPSTKDLHTKPVERPSSNVQQTDDWGPFDAFESSLTPNLPISDLPSTNVVKESEPISIEAVGSKTQSIDNWGSFEVFESVLTPKPSVSNQSLKMASIQSSTRSYIKPAGRPGSGSQKVDNWGSFDAFEKSQPKAASNFNFNLPALSISNGTTTKSTIRPAPSLVVSTTTTIEDDDDDDWGEMVQSPQIPNGGSSFGTVLQPTSPFTPRTLSPVPPQFMQPQPQPAASTMSMYDFSSFETKTSVPDTTSKSANGGGTATWDLSFFDGLGSANKDPVNVSTPSPANQPSHDLWDAPAPTVTGRRLNKKELEEDAAVNKIVEGLPDLGYMLS